MQDIIHRPAWIKISDTFGLFRESGAPAKDRMVAVLITKGKKRVICKSLVVASKKIGCSLGSMSAMYKGSRIMGWKVERIDN